MDTYLTNPEERILQGAFYTPAFWAKEAHAYLDHVLPDWREDSLVWDPAAGCGNLVRDLEGVPVISSTLEASDLQYLKPPAFAYNFVEVEPVLPFAEFEVPVVHTMLAEAAQQGKRLLFLMNPPYGSWNTTLPPFTDGREVSTRQVTTSVCSEMRAKKLGVSAHQLYTQFMFQCQNIAKEYGFSRYTVALFSKPTFMTSSTYQPFRDYWYADHSFQGGFMIQASNFSDVSGAWAVSFTVWNSGGSTQQEYIPLMLKDTTGDIRTKFLYTAFSREASAWAAMPVAGKPTVDAPQFSSGLVVKPSGKGTVTPDSLCYLRNAGNNLQYSISMVYLVSGAATWNYGFSVTPDNWRRAVALYSVRKLIYPDWTNDVDEYVAPDTSLPGYEQWVDDCHVYALIHRSNNCTAMRNVPYKGTSHRIKNQWFWLPRQQTNSYLDLDIQQETTDSYYSGLSLQLSEDAVAVMQQLNHLWWASLPYREDFDKEHPEYHLGAHDAGIFQLKHLWRKTHPTEYRRLVDTHRALEHRLRAGIYQYKFLLSE